MLKKKGLIDDAFISMIMKWRHTSGFRVHNEVRIKPGDDKGIEKYTEPIEIVPYDEGWSGYDDSVFDF